MAQNDIDPTTKEYRRLTTILAADVMGYSALMGQDEEQTVRDIKGHFSIILPMIVRCGGRVIDTAGDGIFAEFASVIMAVRCAVAMQMVMLSRNETVKPDRVMRFRIGINQADVLSDATRIYGDGVNIAARLEAICEPSKIAISAKVYEEVQDKFGLEWLDAGPMELKNIRHPVRVYRYQSGTLPADAAELQAAAAPPAATIQALQQTGSDLPSIAVLPFENMSGVAEQNYFSDGITEDIITELARFSDLEVIARNSAFQYKGKSVDARQVGRELGVRYILEGSVRQSGPRVRVTTQLVDASNGNHLWADRYDRRTEDAFTIQDELVATVAPMLAARVNAAEIKRTTAKPAANWRARDYYLRAMAAGQEFQRDLSLARLQDMRQMADECLRLDPEFARGHILKSSAELTAWSLPIDTSYQDTAVLDRAVAFAHSGVRLDDRDPQGHAQLGYANIFLRRPERALAEFETAMSLNPNYYDWRYPAICLAAGQAGRAIEIGTKYRRLDPFALPATAVFVALAYYSEKRFEDALRLLDETEVQLRTHSSRHVIRAACFAKLGRMDEAAEEVVEVRRLKPDWASKDAPMLGAGYLPPKLRDFFAEGITSAGLS
jgi:adenylate cyclase